MRRERVAQRVRREVLGDSSLARTALDDVPERLARHAIAAPGRKQKVGLALEQDLPAGPMLEVRQPAHRLLPEGNQPLAIALAEDADHALVEIDLAVPQVHQLRDAKPGGIEHLEHGAVTIAERIAHHRRAEQCLDLLLRQRLRQRAPDLRHGDLRSRILAQAVLAYEVTEE